MLLKTIKASKLRIARYYDYKVKVKQFSEGDLVWKIKLLIGSKSSRFGEKSPNWGGPYRIECYAPSNTCILEILRRERKFGRAIKWKIFEGILP